MKITRTIEYEVKGLAGMIRLARKASQKRVEDLASESGMTGGNWYRIESGDAESVPEETLRAMESALGIILVRKLED